MLRIKYVWKCKHAPYEDWEISYFDYGKDGIRVFFQQDFNSPQEARDGLVEFLKDCEYFDEELILVTKVYKD